MTAATAAPPALEVRGVTVRYGTHLALDDVSVSVPTGSTLAIIGPNGSGKSTLLLAVAGLVQPQLGVIERHTATVALVLQSTAVERTLPLTVAEAVRMARYERLGLLGRFRAADRAAVRDAMVRLEVLELAGRQLHELSGGQRQRALVAQGLAQQAEVLLLDEPVTGLDVVSQDVILRVVDEERAAGRTVVLTTHSLDEARRCDRVLLLATRRVAWGPPDEVIRPEHLRDAFGVRAGGPMFLDDPHH